ncbi:MAG: hypothetical protein ACU0AZ_05570 [Paracoccaceae bacterium]
MSTEFATDGAACACDQDVLIAVCALGFWQVGVHFIATQKAVNFDWSSGGGLFAPKYNVSERRQGKHFTPEAGQTATNSHADSLVRGGHGENDTLNPIALDQLWNLIRGKDTKAGNGKFVQACLVVHKAGGLKCVIGLQRRSQLLSSLTSAVYQYFFALGSSAVDFLHDFEQQKTADDGVNNQEPCKYRYR